MPHSHARLDDAAPAQVSFDFEIVDISAAGVGAQANAVPSALLVGDRLELRLELPGRSLPVTATHVLSSGVAGTMVANKSGLQSGTVRNIVMAWVLTLPITIVLSAALFWLAITVIV